MYVEECCQALLSYSLPLLDPERRGACYDIGVGTFAFYCEVFARLGYKTFAVEPFPISSLKRLCKIYAITLIEKCVSDKEGMQTMYLGSYENSENLNLSSLSSDWWGASTKEALVRSTKLLSLFGDTAPNEVSCVKLDVEGAEFLILKQLNDISANLLPKIIMFEYGGGGARDLQQGGWSDKFIEATISSLNTLKQLGYNFTIIIDSAEGAKEKFLDLNDGEISVDCLFDQSAIYGNIITMRGGQFLHKNDMVNICSKFRDESTPPPPLDLPSISLLHKLINISGSFWR